LAREDLQLTGHTRSHVILPAGVHAAEFCETKPLAFEGDEIIWNFRRASLRNLATPGWLKQEVCLHHLAPERGFIASKSVEQTIVEIG
jgi:hypothetical protein